MSTDTAKNNIKKLKENLHSKDTNMQVQQHLNQLDEEFLQSRLRAESELGTKTTQRSPWSPKVDQAYLILQYWIVRKKQLVSGLDYSNDIQVLLQKIQEDFDQNGDKLQEIK